MTLRRAEVQVGDVHEQVVVENLTRTQLVMYAGASGDYNPLHTDEVYATQAAGFPTVFAHGMLTMAMTGRAVTDLVGDGRLRHFGGRFRQQVWPGDTLTTRLMVERVDEDEVTVSVVTRNQTGDEVFVGSASARLDT
jgi:acyl dehydratase